MNYELSQISVGYTDEDGKEKEKHFKNATTAIEFIEENETVFKPESCSFNVSIEESGRHINSASSEPLDHDDKDIDFHELVHMAKEEGHEYTPPEDDVKKVKKTRKSGMRNK